MEHQSLSHWYDSTWEKPQGESGIRTCVCCWRGGRLTTRSPRVCPVGKWTSLSISLHLPFSYFPCVCLLVACLTSQQHASVSPGRICSDNFTCCHTEIEVADQAFHLTHSQYTDTGPTSPSTDTRTPGAWQGSHWSANFYVTSVTRPRKNLGASGIRTRDLPLSRRTP